MNQMVKFSEMIHPDFNDKNFGIRFHRQHSHWNADVIVKIVMRFGHVKLCGQNGSNHVLGRRFAIAAGDCNDFRINFLKIILANLL